MKRIRGLACPPHRETGFSIVETLVALAIVSILIILAFNGRGLVDNRRLEGTARDLLTDVRFIEQQARAQRNCWQIVFDTVLARYTIAVIATYTSNCTGSYTPFRTETLPTRVSLLSTTFPSNTLIVSPFGVPFAIGTVTLQTPSGQQRRIQVNEQGQVQIL